MTLADNGIDLNTLLDHINIESKSRKNCELKGDSQKCDEINKL